MSHKSSALLGNITLWGISGLGVIFFVMIMLGNDTGIDGGLYLAYIALFLGILLALLSGLFTLLRGGDLKGTLLPLGAFLAFFAISYLLADGTVKPAWNISESASKLISAGLNMTAIATLVAVGLAVYGAIMKLIK
jgi:hypothetical protein